VGAEFEALFAGWFGAALAVPPCLQSGAASIDVEDFADAGNSHVESAEPLHGALDERAQFAEQ
jgi:hypothetical protein